MVSRPSVAALTIVRDEAVMLPLWLAHYGGRLGVDHLVVLDDSSTDGSTDGIDAEVRRLDPLPGGASFERHRMIAANRAGAGLLERFDWVIFTDADEFIVPDPARTGSLQDVLATTGTPAVSPLALNLVHDAATEPPLDPSAPVLDQRSYAYFASLMCKPAMKRRAARWALASHGIRCPYRVSPALFMLHLKFADTARLTATANHRHALHLADGRGGGSWQTDQVPTIFAERMAEVDFAAAPEFDADAVDLDSLVQQTPDGEVWRTKKGGTPSCARCGRSRSSGCRRG